MVSTVNGFVAAKDCSFGNLVKAAADYLEACGVPTEDASVDAWLLMEYVSEMSRSTYFLKSRELVSDEKLLRHYEECVSKRGSRMPLQYITHEQEFMGHSFYVDEAVLIPRFDTEVLVDRIITDAKRGRIDSAKAHEKPRVMDLCTGSGCIAISLEKSGCFGNVFATDISPDALEIAHKNALALSANVSFIESDLFEGIDKKQYFRYFDVIVSNPPYITREEMETVLSAEVYDHEPHLALYGPENGLYFYRRISEGARMFLRPGGWLYFEIGYLQAEAVSNLLLEAGFSKIEVLKDLAGLDRVVIGQLSK